jgi:hypothetical protein
MDNLIEHAKRRAGILSASAEWNALRGALAAIIADPDCCAASKVIARGGLEAATAHGKMQEGVLKFLEMLEHGYAPFVEDRLSENMCCNGHMCGCRGASVGEYLAHLLREDTGLARAVVRHD